MCKPLKSDRLSDMPFPTLSAPPPIDVLLDIRILQALTLCRRNRSGQVVRQPHVQWLRLGVLSKSFAGHHDGHARFGHDVVRHAPQEGALERTAAARPQHHEGRLEFVDLFKRYKCQKGGRFNMLVKVVDGGGKKGLPRP